MNSVAILGSGFGLYGYLPALVIHCGQQVVLPERYRERFEKHTELAVFASHVHWAADEFSALRAATGAVLAQSPKMQSHWLATCLAQPQLQYLLLEKPLATDPQAARHWHNKLEESGKVIRIAYLFRYLGWAAELRKAIAHSTGQRVAICWRFSAHHFRHDLKTWKRDHDQGGGAIRFYGIHLIALLAELGYSRVIESFSSGRADGEARRWNASFAGAGLPHCEVEVDSASPIDRFSIACDSSSACALGLEQTDPFGNGQATNLESALDRRVEVLGRFCQSAWRDPRPMQEFYQPVIDLWHALEQCNSARPAFAAA